MKKLILSLILPLAMITFTASPIALVGCANGVHVAAVEPGNDPIVVHSEQAYQLAFDTLDALYQSDLDNRTLILKYAPEVHKQINALKPRANKALLNAKNILKAYKDNRTAENQRTLDTYFKTLEAILKEAQTYQSDITSAVASH